MQQSTPTASVKAASYLPTRSLVSIDAGTGAASITGSTEAAMRGLRGLAAAPIAAGAQGPLWVDGDVVGGWSALVPGSEYWASGGTIVAQSSISAGSWSRRVGVAITDRLILVSLGPVERVGYRGTQATEVYTATSTVQLGDATSNPAISSPGSGSLTVEGQIVANGGAKLGDGVEAIFGDGSDLVVSHDGSNAVIDNNAGQVFIRNGLRGLTLDPELGGDLRIRCYDSGQTVVDTGGAATALSLSLPDGCKVIAWAFRVDVDIEGTDATTITLALTGGSTITLGTASGLTTTTKAQGFVDANAASPIVSGGVANATATLSGGADSVPSAGAYRLFVWVQTIGALDSAV